MVTIAANAVTTYASFCGIGPVLSATSYGLLSAIKIVGMISKPNVIGFGGHRFGLQ